MKIRTGFVSNSSSCSFTVPINKLTPLQVSQIYDHLNLGKLMGVEFSDCGPAWNIWVSDDGVSLVGSTYMDNFDMSAFFDLIGVHEDLVTWGEELGARS